MKLRNSLKKIGIVFLFFSSIFLGCKNSSHENFLALINQVDNFIALENENDALRELANAEKKAYSSYERLAIYKRYIQLNKNDEAEKTLVKAIKKLPQSKELLAVYVNFLLRKNEITKALELSEKLKGTSYESFYSESLIKYALKENATNSNELFSQDYKKKKKKNKKAETKSREEKQNLFYDERFVPIYLNAFEASKNQSFLINASCIYLKKNDLKQAASLYSSNNLGAKDSFYWAQLFYNLSRYSDALKCLSLAENLCTPKEYFNNLCFQADLKYLLEETDESQVVREKLLAYYKDCKSKEAAGETNYIFSNEELIPVSNTFSNSILYAKKNKDIYGEYDLLCDYVKFFPYDIKSLALYSSFALDCMNREEDDEFAKALRKNGLKTILMEENDRLPVVSLNEAYERINYAITNNLSVDFEVLNQMLLEVTEYKFNANRIKTVVYEMLEKYCYSPNLYHDIVVHWACDRLLKYGFKTEAYDVFMSYIKAVSSKAGELDFSSMNTWQLEFLGYFYAANKQLDEANELYSKITDEENSGAGSVSSYVNLAIINKYLKDYDTAIKYFNLAFSVSKDPFEMAEILYRSAVCSLDVNDVKSAAHSLRYSLALNPEHKNSRLLLKYLQAN